MEPTPYIFTPNQWGILRNLVDETGQDMRTVITTALEGLYEKQHDPLSGGLSGRQEPAEPPIGLDALHKRLAGKITGSVAASVREERNARA